jgi:hypothetical protein
VVKARDKKKKAKKKPSEDGVFPLAIRKDKVLRHAADAAAMIVKDSDAQVESRGLVSEEDQRDFRLSCDSLNVWRLQLRVEFDHGESRADRVGTKVARVVCRKRGYDPADFMLALRATRERARIPYGVSPLQLALARSKERPIRLRHRDLVRVRSANAVAGVALELQRLQADAPIYLPINDLRQLMGQRKVVVSGAVMRLIEAGVLKCVEVEYRPGKARLFRFVAKEGTDFDFVDEDEADDELAAQELDLRRIKSP